MPGLRSLVARRRSSLASPAHSAPSSPSSINHSSPSQDLGSVATPSLTGVLLGSNGSNSEDAETTKGQDENSANSKVTGSTVREEKDLSSGSHSANSSDGYVIKGNSDLLNTGQEAKGIVQETSDKVIINGGSSESIRQIEDNESLPGLTGSSAQGNEIQKNLVSNKRKMSIENTLAKRGVTIVRRLVESDDSTQPEASVSLTHAKPSTAVNGSVISANPLAARGTTIAKSGISLTTIKGAPVTLNSRGLSAPVRGGSAPNSPVIKYFPGSPRPYKDARANLIRPGLHGATRLQSPLGLQAPAGARGPQGYRAPFRHAPPRNFAPINKNLINVARSPRVRGPSPFPGGSIGNSKAQGSSLSSPLPKDPIIKGTSTYTDARRNLPNNLMSRNASPSTTQHLNITGSLVPKSPVGPKPTSIQSSQQGRTSVLFSQPKSSTSTQSSFSPHSSSSTSSPLSKGYYLPSKDRVISSLNKAPNASPSRGISGASPQSRISEPSPTSRSAEASPLSRISEASPLSRPVDASPHHRSGMVSQSRYQQFSPQGRPTALSPPSSVAHSKPSPTVITSQADESRMLSQSLSAGVQPSLQPATSTTTGQVQSGMGVLPQQPSDVSHESTLYGQPLPSSHSRLMAPTSSLGYTGLQTSPAYMGRTGVDGYTDANALGKFQTQPNMDSFSSQMNEGFNLHSNPAGYTTQTNLSGYANVSSSCGYSQQAGSGRQYPSQNNNANLSEGYALQPSYNYPLAPTPSYDPPTSSFSITTGTNTYTQNMLSYSSPGNYSNCSQGVSLNPTSGNIAHPNYGEGVHQAYQNPLSFPRIDMSNPSVLSDYRESLQQGFRDTGVLPIYRPESSFNESSLQSTRNTPTSASYRDVPLLPNMSGVQGQPSTGLQSSYKEPVSNVYREEDMMAGYATPHSLSNYREVSGQSGQNYRGTSSRDQSLPSFKEMLTQGHCREEMLTGYREPVVHTSPREQNVQGYSEGISNESPRGQVHPSYNESVDQSNVRSQVHPSYSDSVDHSSPKTQGFNSFREPEDYTAYRESLDDNSITEQQSVDQRVRSQMDYRSEYLEDGQQSQVVGQSERNLSNNEASPDYRNSSQYVNTNSSCEENRLKDPYAKSTVLPSFTESFECGNPADYQKDESAMLQSYGESSGYVTSSRTSECTSSEDHALSTSTHSSTYSPAYSNMTNSPSGSQNGKGESANTTSQDLSLYNSRRADVSKYGMRKENAVSDYSANKCSTSYSTTSPQKNRVMDSREGQERVATGAALPGSSLQYSNGAGPSGATVNNPNCSPSKIVASSSPSSQERIVIKMKLLHRDKGSETHADEIDGPSNASPENKNSARYPNAKYTRWTIDSIINGRVSGIDCEALSEESRKQMARGSLSDSDEERVSSPKSPNNGNAPPTNFDTNKNLMTPLKITLPNPLRSKRKGRKKDPMLSDSQSDDEDSDFEMSPNSYKRTRSSSSEGEVELLSPNSYRKTRSSSRVEDDTPAAKESVVGLNPLRKIRIKSINSPSPMLMTLAVDPAEMINQTPSPPQSVCPSVDSFSSPVSASQGCSKSRRQRTSSERSEASVSSAISVLNESNEKSSIAQVKKCSIVIKRIYAADNSSSYSSTLSNKKSNENNDVTTVQSIENKDVTSVQSIENKDVTSVQSFENIDGTTVNKENEDVTTDQSIENKDATTVNKENTDVTTGNKENKDITTVIKENKDVTTLIKENKDVTIVDKENKDLTIVDKEKKDVAIVDKEKKDVAIVHKEKKDVTKVHKGKKDVTKVYKENKDVTIVHKEKKDVTKAHKENKDVTIVHNRPKRKAAVQASERCHKSLRSCDRNDITNTHKIPYNGAFLKGTPLMPVNLTRDSANVKNVITRCSVILYDVFMNRRINSMVCPGCSRNYDSSDGIQVNMKKATISLLCSACKWKVVKDVHPREVESSLVPVPS